MYFFSGSSKTMSRNLSRVSPISLPGFMPPGSDPFPKLPDLLWKHTLSSGGFLHKFFQAGPALQFFFPSIVALGHNVSSSYFQQEGKQLRTSFRQSPAHRPGIRLPGTFMPIYQLSYLIDSIVIKRSFSVQSWQFSHSGQDVRGNDQCPFHPLSLSRPFPDHEKEGSGAGSVSFHRFHGFQCMFPHIIAMVGIFLMGLHSFIELPSRRSLSGPVPRRFSDIGD